MPNFGKRVDVPGGRRRVQRDRVVLAAAAVSIGRSRSVIVQDVCSSGARLQGRDLPQTGKELIVKVGSVDAMASVAWSDGAECGITFDPPLDGNGVRAIKDEGRLGHVLGVI